MLQHQQFLTNMQQSNNRPIQQSSPSDNSMSTATPPHQISRASPASTALVMSSNNINGPNQPASRELTPSNASSSNNGSSLNSNDNSSVPGGQPNGVGPGSQCPPNPMIRQFCHSKSMSAGVVVPVPGISNNLATATGMNPNNMINNNVASNQHHMRQMNGGHHNPNAQMHSNSNDNNLMKQQVIRENQRNQQQLQQQHHHQMSSSSQQQQQQPTHHHRSISSQHYHNQQQQIIFQQQLQQQQQQHDQQLPHYHQNGSSQNFISARQPQNPSIVLSNQNINNIHNRSASTQLTNVSLGPQQQQQQHRPSYLQHVTNSIWSVDENISKGHGKYGLYASQLMDCNAYNPSITDMSCDNVSNISRLLDRGGPPPVGPGHYMHPGSGGGHHTGMPHSSNAHLSSLAIPHTKTPEFLPICDILFNLISMILYFCENVFAVISLIALYYHATSKYWAMIGATFVLASHSIGQYLSLKWKFKTKLEDCRRKRDAQEELEDEEDCVRDYNRMPVNMRNYQCGSCTWLPDGATEAQMKFLLSIACDAVMHIFCLGFLARYIKLVIPVRDASSLKKDVRDLCMLRMIHGFIQSAPLLLLLAYMICSQNYSTQSIINLSTISALLSLVNVCWALASFTKYARKKLEHKFVLTWLGIVCQMPWRLGTVASRVAALTIYAVYFGYWMLIVVFLHFVVMFLWLMKPGNLLKDELNYSRAKRIILAAGIGWIYCIDYVNFEEQNSRAKIGVFYLIMFLENNLLFTVCQTFPAQVTWLRNLSILLVYLGFVFGMLFMFLYYKYFHVRVLNNGLSCSQASITSIADQVSPAGKMIAGHNTGTLRLCSEDSLTSIRRYNSNISATLRTVSHPEIARISKPPYLAPNQAPLQQSGGGVFSCDLPLGTKKQKAPKAQVRRMNP